MFIVGLTGGFKTGKSTAASMFRSLGAKVISADEISHELIEKDGACFKAVLRIFGQEVLTKGRIDRRKLAKIVFNNRRQLKKLTNSIHPAVKREIQKRIRGFKGNPKIKVVVLDVPLLFEARFDRLCDLTGVVTASLRKQLIRAHQQLGIGRHEALQRIREQMSLKSKIQSADFIIDNDKTKNKTRNQVKEIWQKQLSKIRN